MFSTTEILRDTLRIIQDRGWCYRYSSDPDGPRNIRSAISRACAKLPDGEFYEGYRSAVAALTAHVDTGIQNWEHSASRSVAGQAMIEQGLVDTIAKLERRKVQA